MGLLIGVTGKGRHGKDEIATILEGGYGFKRASFAYDVKDFVMKHLGFSHDEVYVNRTPESRNALQGVGDGCREEFGHSVWINKAFKRWGIYNAKEDIVFSDCRYPNEAESIKEEGGFIIRVIRPNAPAIESGANHRSETSMDEIIPDVTIVNDGSLLDLAEKVEEAYSLLLGMYKEIG